MAHTGRVPVSSYHYLEGPLIAVAALGVIILLCRWVFSTGDRPSAVSPDKPAQTLDFGLLEPACAVRTLDDAGTRQSLLREAGIRSTVTEVGGAYTVLVFAGDARRARDLVRR